MGKEIRENLGCCLQSLMGSSAGNLEDEKADRNVDRKGQAYKMLGVNEGCQEMNQSPRVPTSGRFNSILSCNETFHEANLKGIDELTPVISALGNLRQEDCCEFVSSLCYTMNYSSVWGTE